MNSITCNHGFTILEFLCNLMYNYIVDPRQGWDHDNGPKLSIDTSYIIRLLLSDDKSAVYKSLHEVLQ